MLSKLFLLATAFAWGVLGQKTFNRSINDFPECRSDLEEITIGLTRKQIWALNILDSWTKLPSGLLTGHLVDYGNYDECFDARGNIPTQYCFASITPRMKINDSNLTLTFRWAYCLPISCPPVVLEKILLEILGRDVNVTVTRSDCTSNTSKSISTGDYVGISIWAVFVAFAVFSTIYDVLVENKDGGKKWMSSFSLYTNGKNLFKMDVTPDTMLPLHGLRFLSICWVVLGHRYFFTATSSILNFSDFAEELKKPQSQFFIQGVLAVDTFFLLSGLLNGHHLLKVLEKLKRFPFGKYYLHRYIRLTPVLAAVVIMYATWYPLIGDGPAWAQTTAMWKQLCVDNWLPTLLYINNYYNPISQCAGQSWYLAVDMQLYWLSPLVVLPLWKRPKVGRILLLMLLVASTVGLFIVAFVFQFRMSFTFGLSQEELEKVTKLIYVPTHTRATPYIIGLLIGEYLYTLKREKTRVVFSRGLLVVGWLLSTLVGLSVVFGNFQFSRPITDHPYNRWESSIYISLHRLCWGAVVGWIIITCLNKQGGVVNAVLSLKIFIPLSRLTYCIFLSHMAIQQYNIGTARTSDYFQYFNQVHRYFGDLLFSLLTAAGLSLIFESPILVLEKLIGGKPQEKNLKCEVNNGFQEDSNSNVKTHEI